MKLFTAALSLLFSVSISADTTDVQYAVVQFDNNRTVAVTCHFAEGSQALGCHVQLSFSRDSHTQNISREDGSLIAHQEIMTAFPSHCYQSQLYVYDWEADSKVGTLPIPVETVFSEGASKACGMASGDTTNTTPSNPGLCQFHCVDAFVWFSNSDCHI